MLTLHYEKKQKLYNKKMISVISILLLSYIPMIYSSIVNFYVINDENCISNPFASDLTLEMIWFKNNTEEWNNEEDKITLFKNNIIRYESTSKEIKYYNPCILTLPYYDGMLINSKTIRNISKIKNSDIRIFLKDISYSSLLLFVELIDDSDIMVNQINIQDFFDILIILTVLDVEKSKERRIFLKYLFRNIMFGTKNGKHNFDFNEYIYFNHYEKIKKSIFMEIWIIFIDIITFNDRSAEHFIILSQNANLTFTKFDLYSNSYVSLDESVKNNIYMRLEIVSINKLFKIMNVEYLKNIWVFLFKIVDFEKVFLAFLTNEIYEKAIIAFSNVIFRTKKMYIYFFRNALIRFCKKDFNGFTKDLKVLKLDGYLGTEDLKKILNLCSWIESLTLKISKLNYEQLCLVIDYFLKNPEKLCKVYFCTYELQDTNLGILKLMPNNLLIYVRDEKERNYIKFPLQYIPFFQNYFYKYISIENSQLASDLVLIECSGFKYVEINYNNLDMPFKLTESILTLLRYFKFVKQLFFHNIVINDKLLMYVLKSDTLKNFTIRKFVWPNNIGFLENIPVNNQKLKYFKLFDSLSDMTPEFLDYLEKFRNIIDLELDNIDVDLLMHNRKKYYLFFSRFVKKNKNKIFLKYLIISNKSNYNKQFNYLHFLSKIFDFSKLYKIGYRLFFMTEVEYEMFNTMNELKVLIIDCLKSKICIDLNKLFKNSELFNTVTYIAIGLNEIRREEIEILRKFKNLISITLACYILDFNTVLIIKNEDFRTTLFSIQKPDRQERSTQMNNYLDSEFRINF